MPAPTISKSHRTVSLIPHSPYLGGAARNRVQEQPLPPTSACPHNRSLGRAPTPPVPERAIYQMKYFLSKSTKLLRKDKLFSYGSGLGTGDSRGVEPQAVTRRIR